MDVKNELEKRANISQTGQVRLSKSMTIVDMVKALEPEIRRALPAVITPERFTRMGPVCHQQYTGTGRLYADVIYSRHL